MLQIRTDSDRDICYAAVRDFMVLKFWLKAEQEIKQRINHGVTAWQGHVSDQQSLVDASRKNRQFALCCGFQLCLRYILVRMVRFVRHCMTAYLSGVDKMIWSYYSSVHCSIYFIVKMRTYSETRLSQYCACSSPGGRSLDTFHAYHR